MAKRAETPTEPEAEVPFEQAIERVEEIVAQMEGDRMPLDRLIENYEEGTRLLGLCRKRLDEVQTRVDLITRRLDGTETAEPFADDTVPDAASGGSRSQARA